MLADVHFEDKETGPVARIRGEIDMSNVADLSMTLQNNVQQSAPGLVIDFSQTAYLDSAGLHFIFDLGKRLRDRGQRLELVVPEGSPVQPVLEIVNVRTLADVAGGLDDAIKHLKAHAEDIPKA